MFGWINDCTESLVTTKFGIEKWHEVKEKAKCKVADGGFIRHKYYSDESTVALVVAASEVLGLEVDTVLEAFGQYFMEFTRKNGYDNLLQCQGSTLRLWLSNLNALHDHLQSSLPKGFVAPVFWCEDDDSEEHEGCILLHYYSERGSLLVPLVVGVVKEVSRYHFDLEVNMERLQMQTENEAKFTTWRISAVDPKVQWKLTRTSEGNAALTNMEEAKVESANNTDDPKKLICPFHAMANEMKAANLQNNPAAENNHSVPSIESLENSTHNPCATNGTSKSNDDFETSNENSTSTSHCLSSPQEATIGVSMSGKKMEEVFPYHIVVNEAFLILQYGKKLSSLIGRRISLKNHIKEYLEIKRPIHSTWKWDHLHKLDDQTFFLESMNPLNGAKTKLKANIIHLSNKPKQVMFVISPDAKNVAELHSMNLTMSDLPLHSFQRDAVFLGEHMYSEVRSAHALDKLSKKLATEKNISNNLLYSMLPREVADTLRSGKAYEPQDHENVTLFFSDVVGFTQMSAELDPWEVIDMLNSLYTVMDFLAARFNLYKVETIGDAYMCCSGLPKEDERHCENIANFSLAVKRCVNLVKSPLTGEPIRLRIGIHSGSCMSGVVGSLTPHYCLFGDMVNTTSRHESTGEADKIQASSILYGKIHHFSDCADQYNWIPRGLVEMKGKGPMFTYWLDSGTDKNPYVGPDPLDKLVQEVEAFLATKTWKKRTYFRRSNLSTSSTTVTSLDIPDLTGLQLNAD